MRVETGVAELGHFFGEEFDAIGRVAEDDGLVDLELQDGFEEYSGNEAEGGQGPGTNLGE